MKNGSRLLGYTVVLYRISTLHIYLLFRGGGWRWAKASLRETKAWPGVSIDIEF